MEETTMSESREWSKPTDGAVRSGSATTVTDSEDGNISQEDCVYHAKPHIESTDLVYNIFDQIDEQPSLLSVSQSSTETGSTIVRNMTNQNSPRDVGNTEEDEHSEILCSVNCSSDYNQSLSNLQQRSVSRNIESHDHIVGSVEIDGDASNTTGHFSEADVPTETSEPSDIESAAQIDDKLRNMKRKKSGCTEDLQLGMLSDTETIKTGDYESRIHANMVCNADDQWEPSQADQGESHIESVKPHLNTINTENGPHRNKCVIQSKDSFHIAAKEEKSKIVSQPQTKSLVRYRWTKFPAVVYTSDAESLKKEEFEIKFQNTIEKQSHVETTEDVNRSDDETHHYALRVSSPYRSESSQRDNCSKHITYSKRKPVKMFPTHKPLSFSKEDRNRDYLCDTGGRVSIYGYVRRKARKSQKSVGERSPDSVFKERNKTAKISKNIQKEINKERRSRLPTRVVKELSASNSKRPGNVVVPNLDSDPRGTPAMYKSTITKVNDPKDIKYQLQEAKYRQKDNQSQTMRPECSRDKSLKDLQKLGEEFEKTKNQLTFYDEQICKIPTDIYQADSLSIQLDAIIIFIRENENFKAQMPFLDVFALDRYMRFHQLELTKEILFNEKKRSRLSIQELKEELDNTTGMPEEHQKSKDDLAEELLKTKIFLHEMEKEKDTPIEGKTNECEDLKTQLKIDRSNTVTKVASLEDVILKKDNENGQLRDQLKTLQQQLSENATARDGIIEDHKKTLQTLRKESDGAILKLRETLFLEKQQELESTREEMAREIQMVTSKKDDQLAEQKIEFFKQFETKQAEIKKLQHLIKLLDKDKIKMETALCQKGKEQTKEAVQIERQTLEAKYKWMIKQECDKTEHVRYTLKEKTTLLEQETQLKDSLSEQLQQTKVGQEKTKLQTKRISDEQMVTKTKDQSQQNLLTDVQRFKARMIREHHSEVEKLHKTIHKQEAEMRDLKAEMYQIIQQDSDISTVVSRTERTVVNEINEECRRAADLLGITPRTVTVPSTRAPGGGVLTKTHGQNSPSVITAALANLKACNEELHSHVRELKQETEAQRSSMTKISRKREQVILELRQQVEEEKQDAMWTFNITTNTKPQTNLSINEVNCPYKYKSSLNHTFNASTNPLTYSQEDKFERLYFENKKMSLNQSKLRESCFERRDNSTSITNKLKDRIRHIHTENSALRNAQISSLVPDLSNHAIFRQNMSIFPSKD